MKKILNKLLFFLFMFSSSATILFAEGKPATELNKQVKTEGLAGLNLFLAETYNENRFLYAVISTASVVVFGIIITYVIGLFLKPQKHMDKE